MPAAVGTGLLWISIVAGAGMDLSPTALVALGVAGIGLTAGLLLLIQAQHSRLESIAGTDALTGLPNHRVFHEQLREDLERARIGAYSLAVIALDLDNFKQINDRHGHPYGDDILRAVGSALRGAIRDTDRAARTGGDEFALILPGAQTREAVSVAERVRSAIGDVAVNGFELTCSAGIASFPFDADDASTLLELADSALYWAKGEGKARIRRFDVSRAPTAWTGHDRDQVEAVLALEEPIVPVFQPVVSLATGKRVGYEALARFPSSPDRAPEVWFAQAHGCGLGPELEAAAIRTALQAPGRPLGTDLAVNVTPSALASEIVREALAGDLDGIIVELTEHEFVADDQPLTEALADLRRRGARIALDDAGAGHAGLSQLMRARPDIVKLDRTLTDGIQGDRARMALVESFVRYARDVGAVVCAEGIETLDELATLADLDVQWGQGYALARPSPPWVDVSPIATEICRASLGEAFRSVPSIADAPNSSDRRLVHLSARLAGARTKADLNAALALIAAELGASKVSLSVFHEDRGVVETLAQDGGESEETIFPLAEYPSSERVIRHQEAIQVFVEDPDSDPAEVSLLLALGERSLLMVPVVAGGETRGIVEAYTADGGAWGRAAINRARVIANQCASVIPAFTSVR